MKPVSAKDLLELDGRMRVEILQCYSIPEQVVYQAGRGDYSEIPAHEIKVPSPSKCGEWIVNRLLSNERGHWGPLEHPSITFSVAGYVHNVMVQARTHRIGMSFDVQSQRYTSERILKLARGEMDPEDVFYVRPPGLYTNREGKKYEWTEKNYRDELDFAVHIAKRYKEKDDLGVSEEHNRDYLIQGIRQNFVFSANLRSILHFLDLRSKLDAQLEIQALCEQISPLLKTWAPNVWAYYEEKRLHRARLAP